MRKRSELEISINDWKSAIGMADAFDMAWSVVKGESSNWDWYKKRAPYWKESFAELAEMMPDRLRKGHLIIGMSRILKMTILKKAALP